MPEIIFNDTRYRTHGELPTIGSRAPDVSLVNTKLQNVSLANFGDKRKILNVFPSIDTPVCARSVRVFDKLAAEHENVIALMVSYDLPFAHSRFMEQHELEHVTSLSAMRQAGFGENYGVKIMEGPLEGLFARAVVVLDENNTVVHSEHIEDIGNEPDYQAALKALGIDIDPLATELDS